MIDKETDNDCESDRKLLLKTVNDWKRFINDCQRAMFVKETEMIEKETEHN